ncbi:MAG: hypothetical protein QOF83_2502 [Solirubrobacteraceae bacterium]|nr:hypothetical protein [Solirubrobacteraceae bacterium]
MAPTDDESEISILDARLAEIDRRLHSIQTGLVAERAPTEPLPPIAVPGEQAAAGPPPLPPADAHTAAELLIRLRELTAQQEGVLASMRQLLGTIQRVATTPAAGSPGAGGLLAAVGPSGPGGPVSVSAGPFASTEALRAFRVALEALPGVGAVELRGFEGGDRAILEVHL